MTRATYNYIRGMGSVLDLVPSGGPSRVGQGIDLDRSDAEALRQDWQRVAQDFRTGFDKTTKKAGKHVQSKQGKQAK